MVCTHTLYNMVWDGLLPIKATELPETLERKGRRSRDREHKKCYGTSSSDRPETAAQRMEEGHWEGGTVVGKRAGHEAVVLTLLEKKTENYLAIRIPGKTSKAVMHVMAALRAEYGQHFPQVSKIISRTPAREERLFLYRLELLGYIWEKKDKVDTHKPARKGPQEKSGKAVDGSTAGI